MHWHSKGLAKSYIKSPSLRKIRPFIHPFSFFATILASDQIVNSTKSESKWYQPKRRLMLEISTFGFVAVVSRHR